MMLVIPVVVEWVVLIVVAITSGGIGSETGGSNVVVVVVVTLKFILFAPEFEDCECGCDRRVGVLVTVTHAIINQFSMSFNYLRCFVPVYLPRSYGRYMKTVAKNS